MQVTGGRVTTKEGTTLCLGVWMKPHNRNKKVMLMHNIPFTIVPSPDYMLSIGKNMEREYHVPINEIEELTVSEEPEFAINNNQLEETMLAKAKALSNEAPNINEQRDVIPQLPRIEITTYQGEARLTNNEEVETIYPPSVSHHNILSNWNIETKENYIQPKEYQVTVGDEITIKENEEDIKNLLPPEFQDYKDVFQIPKGLPPDRGKWNFKLNITREDLDQLPTSKPKEIGKDAEKATKEMLDQYLKDGWIEPANYDHAVNMFPVPKQDGTFRYVYNYVPVNKICRINKNPIRNLSDNIDILAAHPFRIALDLRAAYNQILIKDPITKEATAFITPYRIFQWNVMPFGLSDAPPHFQAFMNHVLFEKLKKVYLDDVLIYGKTKKECIENCKWVLNQFRKFKLFCKIKKCEFFPDTIT